MKITVGVPSRGRPLDLIASILTLDKLKSGGNEVDYIVAHDADDTETGRVVTDLMDRGLPVLRARNPARPLGLGELHNMMAEITDSEAVFLLWSDRVIATHPEWDHAVSTAVMQFPNRVLWMDSIHLLGAGQFILPPQWRHAQGLPCPGYFPFWFEDSAVEEVDLYVHGFPRMQVYAKCAGPRVQKTNRMRDLPFWIDFYARLRPQRIAEARNIARKLGMPARTDLAMMTTFWEQRDADFLARAEELTERFGATEPPDESYLCAKARAETMLGAMIK